ncbi:hypothetical protein PRK78_007220 [Emydomyces testavorans]|uniref:Uncharacterized protein n=1 Tax=Emydomyces testavorans TaxID=2070801 RepID=A0AAF0DMU1_9EURO|nr:hypothetical protein PRK78_007220 [Emydomyces testavorans]
MPIPRYEKQILDCTTPLNLESLIGKSVVVTGGAMGLGREYVKSFAAAGFVLFRLLNAARFPDIDTGYSAYVTFGDINETQSAALTEELPGKVQFVKCDVRSWEDQVRLFEAAISSSPSKSCDIVIANAGILGPDAMGKITDPSLPPPKPDTSIIDINLIGLLYTAKLATHYFRRQQDDNTRDRCLILKSSLGGYLDQAGSPFYCASKFAVRGLMRSLRRTSWLESIRVNLVAPWYAAVFISIDEMIIETPLIGDLFAQYLASRGIKFASKEDACAAMLRIASDRTVNGRSLAVVNREDCPEGYLDLDQDDFPENTLLRSLQDAALHATPGLDLLFLTC